MNRTSHRTLAEQAALLDTPLQLATRAGSSEQMAAVAGRPNLAAWLANDETAERLDCKAADHAAIHDAIHDAIPLVTSPYADAEAAERSAAKRAAATVRRRKTRRW